MYLTLSQIKYTVDKLAKLIEAPTSTLPTFGHSEQTGRPHVEVDDKGYHYVIAERGQEFQRHTTSDLDELLYNIFQSVTFTLACSYELNHLIAHLAQVLRRGDQALNADVVPAGAVFSDLVASTL